MIEHMNVYYREAGDASADESGWYIIDGDAVISGPFDCEEEAFEDLEEMST